MWRMCKALRWSVHLTKDEKIHMGEQPYESKNAVKPSTSLHTLLNSRSSILQRYLVYIEKCGKSFSESVTLTKHQKVPTGEKT